MGFGQRLVSVLPVALTLDWSSSALWAKCDLISVRHFFDKTLQATNSNFIIATSPSPVQIRSDCILI